MSSSHTRVEIRHVAHFLVQVFSPFAGAEAWELQRRTTVFHSEWHTPFLPHDGVLSKGHRSSRDKSCNFPSEQRVYNPPPLLSHPPSTTTPEGWDCRIDQQGHVFTKFFLEALLIVQGRESTRATSRSLNNTLRGAAGCRGALETLLLRKALKFTPRPPTT